jgi:hypothetical protein
MIKNTLVEIQTVEIESHGATPRGSEPNTNYWPGSKEEVK